jgi:drug/metabolite transporter (DMT)-like permease
MNEGSYPLGVASAVLAGATNYLGLALQKKAVNGIPEDSRDRLMRKLLLHPLWALGLFLYIVLSTAFYMLAQYFIGPALVPGIMASGLMVLVVAAVVILGERIRPTDIAGVVSIALGTALLAASGLAVDSTRLPLTSGAFMERVAILTASLLLFWAACNVVRSKMTAHKALLKGLAAGFPYCVSNLWISVLYAAMGPVFGGTAGALTLFLFVLASAVLISTNVFGITELQAAFAAGSASVVVPVQQVPVQIAPVFYYYYVFGLRAPSPGAPLLVILGLACVIAGGFLLGSRQQIVTRERQDRGG